MTQRDAILQLLGKRGQGKTICPSEAARMVAGDDGDWRAYMPAVHAAADQLSAIGAVILSQKGVPVQFPVGAYRIALLPAKDCE